MEPAPVYPFDTAEVDETDQTQHFVWRIAAIMLLAITAANLLIGFQDITQVTARQWIYQAVNLLLVYGLLKAKPWARTWTVLRAILAVAGFAVYFAVTRSIEGYWADAILFTAIVIVLIGKPNRRRAILGGALFSITFVGVLAISVLGGFIQAPDPLAEKVSLAFQHLDQHEPEAAAQIFAEVTSEQPDLPEAHVGLGLAYVGLDRLDDALAEFDIAVEVAPEEAAAWGLRAQVLKALERYEPAVSDFDKAISLSPDEAVYHRERADALLALERYDEALASANTALELDEADPMNYALRAWSYVGLGDNARALADFEQAILKLPAGDPGIAEIEGIIETQFPGSKQIQ